jgi:hypothetical protein
VAKETTILGRVTVRERCFFVLIMTFEAKFFSILFIFDPIKTIVDFIMGKGGSRFFGSIEEEDKDSSTNNHK